jgi:hypothetical protein
MVLRMPNNNAPVGGKVHCLFESPHLSPIGAEKVPPEGCIEG